MTLKETLTVKFKLRPEQFHNWASDLYILPDSKDQQVEILSFLTQERCFTAYLSYSNVEGQSWYGKRFIEIPFAYCEHFAERTASITSRG